MERAAGASALKGCRMIGYGSVWLGWEGIIGLGQRMGERG